MSCSTIWYFLIACLSPSSWHYEWGGREQPPRGATHTHTHTHTLSRSLFLYIFILLWEVIKNRFCWWHSKASWTDSISWPFLPPVKYLKSAIQCECQWDPFVTRQAHTHNSMLQILLVRKLNKNPPKNTDYYLMTLKNKIFLSAEINIY